MDTGGTAVVALTSSSVPKLTPAPAVILPAAATTADPVIVEILANTQNSCLKELGYHSTLLLEFKECKEQCEGLRAVNQKLYTDNRNLAQRIQGQDQLLSLLQAPTDQQKRTISEMYERLWALASERDDFARRLHVALDEIRMLRQELLRFVPSATLVSPREPVPSGSVPRSAAPGQSYVPHPVVPTHVQPVRQPNASTPAPATPHYHRLPAQRAQPIPSGFRQIQFLPHHRPSLPAVYPIDTSAPPSISLQRRPSAPTPLTVTTGGSPIVASPLNNFSGLSLGSAPTTPVSSRPGSAMPPPPLPTSRPSSRGLHIPPPVSMPFSSSSLVGAVVGLTTDNEEDTSRKRRKLDHTPQDGTTPPGAPVPSDATAPLAPLPYQPVPAMFPPTMSGQPSASHPVENDNTSGDFVMSDSAAETETTLEEECVEAGFEDDDEDESKRWCAMCRIRYQQKHTTEPPTPFVGASVQQLIDHCKVKHPSGWEVLKKKVQMQRIAWQEEEV